MLCSQDHGARGLGVTLTTVISFTDEANFRSSRAFHLRRHSVQGERDSKPGQAEQLRDRGNRVAVPDFATDLPELGADRKRCRNSAAASRATDRAGEGSEALGPALHQRKSAIDVGGLGSTEVIGKLFSVYVTWVQIQRTT